MVSIKKHGVSSRNKFFFCERLGVSVKMTFFNENLGYQEDRKKLVLRNQNQVFVSRSFSLEKKTG